MNKINEFFLNNKQTISFIMMLALLVIMIVIFIYLRQNVEYVKMDPCGYWMNKTKFTCIYYDNFLYGNSKQEINLTLEQIKQLNEGNYSAFR